MLITTLGSTSDVTHIEGEPGWVTKSLRVWDNIGYSEDGLHALHTETAILTLLTGHPRIVE
jgi:hypothetical protein